MVSSSKTVSFVMLNPNQADEVKNDPTITRCARFAQDWGFSRLDVVNLFALIKATPKDLIGARNPVGKLNDYFVLKSVQNADLIIAAWGNYGKHKERSTMFLELARQNNLKLSCLKVNLSGEPMHPLYVAKKVRPIDYN